MNNLVFPFKTVGPNNLLLESTNFVSGNLTSFIVENSNTNKFIYFWELDLNECNFVINLDSDILNKIQNNKIKIIIDISTGELSTKHYYKVKNFVEYFNISLSNIYILVNTEYEQYELLKIFDINIPKVINTNRNKILFVNDVLGNKKPKRFLFLSRRWTPERFFIYLDLRRRGLLSDTIYSMSLKVNPYNFDQEDLTLKQVESFFQTFLQSKEFNNFTSANIVYEYWMSEKEKIFSELPKLLDNNAFANQHSLAIGQAFNLSHMSLCVETNMDDDVCRYQPSEKIYKCCYYRHPFIVYSNPKFLEKWNKDHRSFANIIDESYDNEIHFFNRVDSANNQVEFLNSLDYNWFVKLTSWKCGGELNHNQNQITKMFTPIIDNDTKIANLFTKEPYFSNFENSITNFI